MRYQDLPVLKKEVFFKVIVRTNNPKNITRHFGSEMILMQLIDCNFQCVDFHMIEYSSELWFMTSNQQQLLSNKVRYF